MNRVYLCIDLKSFYASVECAERGLDAMTTNLVVADPERSKGTICLAVSPSLKQLGIKNRCRLFEIPNNIDYIIAPPRMKLYIQYSADIYGIYLKYISKDDISVYSIDEAFLDVTDYLNLYNMTAYDLALRIMNDIKNTLGVTATCGIGTNLYLAKVALDITAKHINSHIATLTEESYKDTLWSHKPLTDFWRIGRGISKRLSALGIYTMKDIAMAEEQLLYKTFGIDAEYLIDHAWGREPTTISDIKSYIPKSNSLSSGQVLMRDYSYDEALLIVKEMVELLCLELVDRHLVTNSISLYISYSKGKGGIPLASSTNGSVRIPITTSSVKIITTHFIELYKSTTNTLIPIRKINICFNNVINEIYEQYDLFTPPEVLEKDRRIQQAVLSIKKKYGKNSVLKGMNLLEHATTIERNHQIGGHKSGE
ncbi:MAG: DNA repair protein [Lachnospiraceae bacterium]|nr:DNA repair protein [Lachnospiraceae bacterium]